MAKKGADIGEGRLCANFISWLKFAEPHDEDRFRAEVISWLKKEHILTSVDSAPVSFFPAKKIVPLGER